MIRIGLAGFGYWGPNLARNFFAAEGSELATICDLNEANLKKAGQLFPGTSLTNDYDALLKDPRLDVIVIATPVSTHYSLARAALAAGKHVWLEKPMTETGDQARELVDLAAARNLGLHVDHTFVYNSTIRKIRELVQNDTLGSLQYYDSTRINLGLFQHDVDVIWDLAIHDFTILDFLVTDRPSAISATGNGHITDSPENIAFITLFYPNNFIAHINVNWLSPVKIRRIILGGDKKMIVSDDLEPIEKIKVYDKGVQFERDQEQVYKMRIGYRIGDMWSPSVSRSEALATEAKHFLERLAAGRPSLTDGRAGLRVVNWLEAATASMKQKGLPIPIVDTTGE